MYLIWLLMILLIVAVGVILFLVLMQTKQNVIMGGSPKSALGIKNVDTYIYGNGGSNAVIILTKDKRVFKAYPHFRYTYDYNIPNLKTYVIEINAYKMLTKNVHSDHIVKYINDYVYPNAEELFSLCPKKLTTFLGNPPKNMDTECYKYYMNSGVRKLDKKIRVLEIEYCDIPGSNYIKYISKLNGNHFKLILDIFLFQIIHTILSIKEVYPYFIHGDLFIRNIMCVDGSGKRQYTYKGKNYSVSETPFIPKINDFGMTNLDKHIKHTEKLYKSDYKDIYNLLLDLYNGGNLGSESLTKLMSKKKLPMIKSYFATFFDVGVIDLYIKNNKYQMDWDWYTVLDDDFIKSIKMKTPEYLMEHYFYDLFGDKKV